jgi:hypothetical protein
MKSVRDACEIQPNALSTKSGDLDELITADSDGRGSFEMHNLFGFGYLR